MATSNDGVCRIVRDSDGSVAGMDFDPAQIRFGSPKALTGVGAKIVPVSYGPEGAPLMFESPALHAPMGVSVWEGDADGAAPKKASLMLSFRGQDSSPEIQAFADAMGRIDETVVGVVASRVEEFLKKSFSEDTVRQLHTPICRKSEKYPASLKVALPVRRDGSKQYTAYDLTKRGPGGGPALVDLDDVEVRNSQVRVIFTITSIWLAGANSFGVSVKAVQVAVRPEAKLASCAFGDLGDDVLVEDDAEDHGLL
jgi:hypothetical protein